MRIAVNTRLLLPNRLEGIGWFMHQILSRMTIQHPEHEFIFIFDRPFGDEFIYGSNVKGVYTFPQARHPLLWYLYFDWGVPSVLVKHKPDLFFSPDGWLSMRTNVPSIPVIHDLNFLHFPEIIQPLVRRYYHYYFPKFAAKAARIATVSEFSKQDIASKLNVDIQAIDVVYNGVNEGFKPLTEQVKQQVRSKFSAGKPYMIHVGLMTPRKNIQRIIKAYDEFRKNNDLDHKLIFAGSSQYIDDLIKNALKNSPYKQDIILTGRIEQDDMFKLVGSADAVLYPSIFEGFGVPLLEAMKCQVPVLTSKVTSMPEIAGNAAHYIDHLSTESIAEGMRQLTLNPALRNSLVNNGILQAGKFGWQKSADLMWQSFEKLWQ